MNSLNLKNVKIVLVGDAKEIEAQVQSIGTITKISADDFDLASPNLKTTKQIETKPVSIPKSDPAAEELMMSALKAHGGDAFLKVKSLVMRGKGELTPPGQTITLPVESATLTFVEGKGRIALKTGFGEIIFASSGKGKGWLNAMGNLQDTPATLTSPTEILRLAANGLAAKDGSYSAALLPDIADAEGKSQQGFSLTDSSGKTTSVYLDKETHLLRRTFTGDGKKGMNLSLSEYKAFEGVMAPGNLKIFQGEKILANITLTEYVINKPVDEKQFEKPVK